MNYALATIVISMLSLTSCQTLDIDGMPRLSCERQLKKGWPVVQPGLPEPDAAKKLARAYLCAPESENPIAYIQKHLADEVVFSTYETGDLEEERRALKRDTAMNEVRVLNGNRNYTYGIYSPEMGTIMLIASSEACVASATLSYHKRWVVTEFDDACD